MKYLALLLLALALASAEWELYNSSFQNVSIQPSDLEGWVFNKNTNNNEFSYCGDLAVVGGYQSTGAQASIQKTFKSIPTHYRVKVQVTVFFIDSWDNEEFQVYAGTDKIISERSEYKYHTPICGSGKWGERITTLEAEFAHNDQDLTLTFTSTLNQGSADESWGIRDFQLFIAECEGDCQVLSSEFSGQFKASDVKGWHINTGGRKIKNPIWACNGQQIYGGYNRFGQKTKISKKFTKIPDHYKIIVNFKIWQIDSWDGSEGVRLVIDGKSQYFTKKNKSGGFSCQGSGKWQDNMVEASAEFAHFGDDLTLRFEDNLGSRPNDESWGISDLNIYVISCKDGCNVIASELTEDSFAGDSIKGWVNKDGAFDSATACTRTSLAGGFNVLAGGDIWKNFGNLPAHSQLSIGVEFWLIDSWDAKENLTILVDDIPVHSISKSDGDWKLDIGQVCGRTGGKLWQEQIHLVYITVPHFGKTAKITFRSNLNQLANDESWGYRDFHLYTRSSGLTQVSQGLSKDVFKKASDDWKVTNWNHKKSPITTCAGKSIFGGYNTFSGKQQISRKVTKLPDHDYIVVAFEAYFLDDWENEAFLVQIDGVQRKQMTRQTRNKVPSYPLCGQKTADFVQFVELTFQHSASEAEIKFYTMLNESAKNESWGIRNFHLMVGSHKNWMPDCPTLYSECNYQGESFNLCSNVPNFKKSKWTDQVKSVWVPEGWKITLYENVDYAGKKQLFEKPVECLSDGPKYSFLSIHSTFLSNLKAFQPHLTTNLRKSKL